MSLLSGAGRGAAAGLSWGVAARVWMRAISTEPEFSWSGTLTILVLATWLGAGMGLLRTARSRGRRPWWALLGLPGVALFASPGAALLPAFALGGLAVARRSVLARVVGGLAVATPAVALGWATAREPGADIGSVFVIVSGFALLSVALAMGGAPLWIRAAPGAESAEVGALRTDGGVLAVAGVDDRRVG